MGGLLGFLMGIPKDTPMGIPMIQMGITMRMMDGIRNSELLSGPTRFFRTEKLKIAMC